MQSLLLDLPLELLQRVITYLDLDDFHSLTKTCRELSDCLAGEGFCRETMERCFPFSREAALARRDRGEVMTWREATSNAARVRSALANGRPYSAITLGLGSSFAYNQGVLCYISCNRLRVLRIHEDTSSETVIEIPNPGNANGDRNIQIISSRSTSVVMRYKDSQFQTNNLLSYVALDLGSTGDPTHRIRRFHTQMPYNAHSFVRQTASEAVYGYLSPSLNGWHGHRQWIFESWKFSDNKKRMLSTLHTHPGNDIGTSVVFEIFDDSFYVISSQDTLTSEDANPVSRYYVTRYPLTLTLKDEVLPNPTSWTLKRRLHREGPLDDNWTNLRLCKDESSDRLMITETRKEWVEKLRNFKRTHYSQDLDNGAEYDELESSDPRNVPNSNPISTEEGDENSTPPPDVIQTAKQQLETLLSRRAQQISQEPIKKTSHSEYQGDSPPLGYRDFLSSRVRYSAYNKSSAAYLDLVIDETLANSLRVRIQSRRKRPWLGGPRHLTALHGVEQISTKTVEEDMCYVDAATSLWPRSDAPQQLFEMLNPVLPTAGVKYRVVSDERSIIYMAESPYERRTESQPIILINFDPAIKFDSLPRLGESWPLETAGNEIGTECQASSSGTHGKGRSRPRPTCQKVQASWKSIRKGFCLR